MVYFCVFLRLEISICFAVFMKNKQHLIFYLFVCCLLCIGQNGTAQKITSKECLKMWKDKSLYPQQEIINDLFFNFNKETAAENLKEFQHYIAKNSNPRIQANVLIYKTYYLIRDSRFDENFDALSSEILREIKNVYPTKDENLLAWLYFLYGEVNLRKDHVEESLFYNLKADEIFEKLPDAAFPEKSNIYHSITRALFFSREYDKAVEYGKKCEIALEKEGKMVSDTRVYNCDFLFTSLMNLDKVSEAEHYVRELKKVLDIYHFDSERINEIWKGVYTNYSGQVLMRKGNHEEALDKFRQALALVEKNEDISNIISLKTNIGSIYFAQNKLAEAEKEWLKALDLSEKYIRENIQDRKQTVKILSLLTELYSNRGNYMDAFRFSEKYNEHRAILDNQVQSASIRVAHIKMRNEFIENELEQYSKDLKTEKLLRWITIFVTILILFSLLYMIFTIRRNNQLKLEVKEKERLIVEEDLANAEKNIQDFKRLITSKNNIISELSAVLPTTLSTQTKSNLDKYTILTDADWEEFRIDFSKSHPMFFGTLKSYAPEITPAMLRLSALVYLELTNDEIANSLGIDKESVARSLRRLRAFLKLKPDENLPLWLQMYYTANIVKE